MSSLRIQYKWKHKNTDPQTFTLCNTTWTCKPCASDLKNCSIQCKLPDPKSIIYFTVNEVQHYKDENTINWFMTGEINNNSYCIDLKISDFYVINPTRFTEESELDDVVFTFKKEKLFLNKTLLSYASDVFQRMFHSNFKESHQREIALRGKSIHTFIDFLSSFYNCCPWTQTKQPPINLLRATRLYSLYDEYQMTKCLEVCRDEFKKFYDTVESGSEYSRDYVSTILQQGIIAETHTIDWLLENVITHLSQIRSQFWKNTNEWSLLSDDTQVKILLKAVEKYEVNEEEHNESYFSNQRLYFENAGCSLISPLHFLKVQISR